MSETNVNSTVSTEEKVEEKLKITVKNPVSFDPVADVAITSTNIVADLINDLFRGVFKDYYGCCVDCAFLQDRQIWVVMPKLYFHVLAKDEYEADADGHLIKGGYTAFRPLGAGNSNDMLKRVQDLSRVTTSGTKVEITKEAKSIFEDFVILPNIANAAEKFNWNDAYTTLPNASETFIMAYKFDILKFAKKIYGEYDANGSKLYYQVTPVYSIVGGNGMQGYKQGANWNIEILRINEENEKKSAQIVGLGVPMYDNTPVMVKA